MSSGRDSYVLNSRRVWELVGFHDSIRSGLTSVVDISDLLRSAVVLSASALDTYVHDIVRVGIIEIYDGRRAPVPGYERFRVSLGCFRGLERISSAREVVESEVRRQHSFLSFQSPEKIADAVRCISEARLWDEVGRILNLPARDVKDQLTLIVDRRNKIAHEADIDPTYGQRWPISSSDVMSMILFLDSIVDAIDAVVAPSPP